MGRGGDQSSGTGNPSNGTGTRNPNSENGDTNSAIDKSCVNRYSWEEIKKHDSKTDRWLVIDGQVYDITQWAKRHPGGSSVIGHYAGQDASEPFTAFHNDLNYVKKYLKAIHIGRVDDAVAVEDKAMRTDFDNLRKTAENMGLFRPSAVFYVAMFAQVLVFDMLAYLILSYMGVGWTPFLLSLACSTIVQAQAGWLQHDFGHLSVFSSSKLNHFVHGFTINWLKGASRDWWNHLHFQHHSKPNVMGKDPDVRLDALFVFGETVPKKVAQENKSNMPYNWQQYYFFIIGPPLLFPIYFQVMMFRHDITRKKWVDLFWMTSYYVRFVLLFVPLLGVWNALLYYFAMRVLESHWFVWVSQSNHIPMEISPDKERHWLPLQLHATCDIEKSAFNDWFTGHLNFQIEHHLFPRMPRHNLYKIAPLARSLCKKHNVPYTVKTLPGAFGDIVRTLKSSGDLWKHYYEAYNHA